MATIVLFHSDDPKAGVSFMAHKLIKDLSGQHKTVCPDGIQGTYMQVIAVDANTLNSALANHWGKDDEVEARRFHLAGPDARPLSDLTEIARENPEATLVVDLPNWASATLDDQWESLAQACLNENIGLERNQERNPASLGAGQALTRR